MTPHSDLSDITTPQGLADSRPDLFTRPQIDWLLRCRRHNGLQDSGAVLKLGKKIYLRQSVFVSWMMARRA